jgi:hypothetical protein
MAAIQELLGPPAKTGPTVTLRTHRSGDIGWVVARHGEIYTQEYGWDDTFEGLVAEIAGKFLTHFDPARERCWIAELDGERAGCVFPREAHGNGRQAPLAAGRAFGARPLHRHQAGGRLHRLRPRGRIPQAYSVDPE